MTIDSKNLGVIAGQVTDSRSDPVAGVEVVLNPASVLVPVSWLTRVRGVQAEGQAGALTPLGVEAPERRGRGYYVRGRTESRGHFTLTFLFDALFIADTMSSPPAYELFVEGPLFNQSGQPYGVGRRGAHRGQLVPVISLRERPLVQGPAVLVDLLVHGLREAFERRIPGLGQIMAPSADRPGLAGVAEVTISQS